MIFLSIAFTQNNHSYICDCLPGWMGRNCDIPSVRASRLEDCQSQPCLHGVCSNHRCVCDVGYTGKDDFVIGKSFEINLNIRIVTVFSLLSVTWCVKK